MEWRLRRVIDVAHFFPFPLLRPQLHRGLEAIDIQAQRSIEFRELPISMFTNEPIIADHLADNRSIFLLYKALIHFLIGSSTRECHLFLFTIGHQCLIDAPLHRYQYQIPRIGKGKSMRASLDGCQHCLLTAIQEGQAFRPASRYIRESQRVQIASLDASCPQ